MELSEQLGITEEMKTLDQGARLLSAEPRGPAGLAPVSGTQAPPYPTASLVVGHTSLWGHLFGCVTSEVGRGAKLLKGLVMQPP